MTATPTAQTTTPTATSTGTRLPVLQPKAVQDCSSCRLLTTCWRPTNTPQIQAASLLACRFERGIEPDRTMRLFLALCDKRLTRFAKWVARRTRQDVSEIRHDLINAMYDGLRAYVIGERYTPIQWLFGPKGAVRHAALNLIRQSVRSRSTLSYGGTADASAGKSFEGRLARLNAHATSHRVAALPMETVASEHDAVDPSAAATAMASWVQEVVEDGVTLTLEQYRVVRFCMQWTDPSRACVVQGALAQYARLRGVTKSYVQQVYTEAKHRLADAIGVGDTLLRRQGLDALRRAARQRTSERQRRRALLPEDIADIGRHPHVPAVDLAWALGLSERVVRRFRSKA